MGEIVTKEDFWQIILNDSSQFGQITTEDEEFNEMSSFVWTVVQNTLINTEDDNYIKSYEDMIGISGEGLTQYQRKVNILYMLSTKNYLALNLIKRGLINMGLSEFVVEHIKEENKVVVHTDRVDDDKLVVISAILDGVLPKNIEVKQYNHRIDVSWQEYDKYANCTGYSEMKLVDPEKNSGDYTTDFTSDGEWCHSLESFKTTENRYHDKGSILRYAKNKVLELNMPELTNGYAMFSVMEYVEEIVLNAPKLTNGKCLCMSARKLKSIKMYAPNLTSIHWAFWNVKSFSNFECDLSDKITDMNNAFESCQLNKESVLRIARTVGSPSPTGDKKTTLGIHVNHKTDEEVLDAIATLEAKGWVVTVQWNGTPTAQASVTYGLRKPPIYARVDELEHFDGTIERVLNWGHYVTNPEDYQEFSSLEEAYEHFGLEKPTF